MSNFNDSGSKYLRDIHLIDGKTDVYAVLAAFNVTCPARQHAIKKLLCSGLRGKGDVLQDLEEANDAVFRAIQMQKFRASNAELVIVNEQTNASLDKIGENVASPRFIAGLDLLQARLESGCEIAMQDGQFLLVEESGEVVCSGVSLKDMLINLSGPECGDE